MTTHTAAPRRASPPGFRALDPIECEALLARNSIGRIAFTFHDRVDIEPLHYVLDGDWLFCRTSQGAKVSVIGHNPWVAFEVDEVHGPLAWASVVVHGTVYHMHQRGSAVERQDYERALAALRRVFPATLTADDPVGFRRVIVGIHVDTVTGRAASA
jgi:uncharacterized protein